MTRRNRARFSNLRHDLIAGSVLGIESVPDGLATGLLAGVNPLAGVYGYMVGTAAGALATSSAFMAVQGTGAMAILIADVSAVHDAANPARALFTLAMLTGVVMVSRRCCSSSEPCCVSYPTPSWWASSTPSG